jgi:hypothetical protein
MEYDNNHFIIASQAYSLQSLTRTRVNNLVYTCIYKTYGIHVLSVRVACCKPDLQIWHFQFCVYLHVFTSLRITHSQLRLLGINLVFRWDLSSFS